MHLLYLHQYFCPPGGIGNNRSFELARSWVEKGHSITFISSTAYFSPELKEQFRGKSFPIEWEVEGIRVILVDVAYSHMMEFRERIKAFYAFYRKGLKAAESLKGIDLIYASSTPLTVGELGRKLARKMTIPFVYECVDVWPDVPIGMGVIRNPLLKSWLHRRTRRIYEEAAQVVTLSEGMKEQILSHGLPAEKVHVIHNGTHPEQFPFLEKAQRGPEAEDKIVRVVYTGTVGKANGLDQLVRAAEWIGKKRQDIQFLVLGKGNDWERVRSLAESLKLKNLAFLPPIPKEQVGAFLAAADIGVVCFAPFKVLEANSANKFYDTLSSGLPVVINYQGWQATYLKEWNCGLSSPQGDTEAFAKNIIRLADDPALRVEMGKQGRKLVEVCFDRRKLAEKLMTLLEASLPSQNGK